MQVNLNSTDTLVLDLGDGLTRQISYNDLKAKYGIKKKTYDLSHTGALAKRIWHYDYATLKGKYVNGHKASSEALSKTQARLIAEITELFPHEQAQFKDWLERNEK